MLPALSVMNLVTSEIIPGWSGQCSRSMAVDFIKCVQFEFAGAKVVKKADMTKFSHLFYYLLDAKGQKNQAGEYDCRQL